MLSNYEIAYMHGLDFNFNYNLELLKNFKLRDSREANTL